MPTSRGESVRPGWFTQARFLAAVAIVVLLFLPLWSPRSNALWAQGNPAGDGNTDTAKPADPPAPANPDADQFAESMRSTDSEEWVRGLTRLSRHFSDQSSEQSPPWVAELLRLYLIGDEADQHPARTRKLLASPEMVVRFPCEAILFELLEKQGSPFLEECENAISVVASFPERRAQLLEGLESSSAAAVRPNLFRRLFRILAGHDPAATVALAMRRLGSSEDPLHKDIVEALRDLLGFAHDDAAAWLGWWKENKHKPISHYLVTREREKSRDEAIGFVKRFLGPLRAQPAAYREAVLDLLGRSPEFQRLAIDEVPRIISASTPKELTPLADRLIAISPAGPGGPRAGAGAEDRALQLAALSALRDLPASDREGEGFDEYEPLLAALRECVGGIPAFANEDASRAESAQWRWQIGRTAAEIAGALRAPISAEIEAAVTRQLDADNSPASWSAACDPVLTILLRELVKIGGRPETLPLMERIFTSERLPDDPERDQVRRQIHELAVQVIGSKPLNVAKTDEAKAELARFFERALDRTDAGQVHFWAITGLANLKETSGIELLSRVVLREGGGNHRKEAAAAIFRIGGLPAVRKLREIHEALDDEAHSELRGDVFASLRKLCLQGDEDLEHLEELLLPENADGARVRSAWFDRCVADAELMQRLDPERLPELTESEALYQRWVRLRVEINDSMVSRALAAEGDEALVTAYAAVREATAAVLQRVAPEDPRLDGGVITKLRQHELIGRRGILLELLQVEPEPKYPECMKALRELLEAEQVVEARIGHFRWIVERLQQREKIPAAFVEGLNELPTTFSFTIEEATQELLGKLSQDGEGVVESKTEAAPVDDGTPEGS